MTRRRSWGLPDLPTGQIVAGNYLRHLRESNRFPSATVCRLLGLSHRELNRVESGSRALTRQQAESLLAGPYQVPSASREGFARFLHEAAFNVAHDGRSQVITDYGPGWLDRLAALEHLAHQGHVLHRHVPEFLQTSAYRAICDVPDQKDLQLTHPTSIGVPGTMVVLDEAVLLSPYGRPALLAEQLSHLLDAVRLGHIRLRILPLSAPVHGETGQLTEMRLPGETLIYAIADMYGVTYRSGLQEEQRLGDSLRRVTDAALPEAESHTYVQRALDAARAGTPLSLS